MKNTNTLKAVCMVNGSVHELLSTLLTLWRYEESEIQETCLLLKKRFEKDCVSLPFSTNIPIETNIRNWETGSFTYNIEFFEMQLSIHHKNANFVIVEHCEVCDGDPWGNADFTELRVNATSKKHLREILLFLDGIEILQLIT